MATSLLDKEGVKKREYGHGHPWPDRPWASGIPCVLSYQLSFVLWSFCLCRAVLVTSAAEKPLDCECSVSRRRAGTCPLSEGLRVAACHTCGGWQDPDLSRSSTATLHTWRPSCGCRSQANPALSQLRANSFLSRVQDLQKTATNWNDDLA